jgi:hypothetical protein
MAQCVIPVPESPVMSYTSSLSSGLQPRYATPSAGSITCPASENGQRLSLGSPHAPTARSAGSAGPGPAPARPCGPRRRRCCGQAKLQKLPKRWSGPGCGLTIWKEIAGRKTLKTDVKMLCKAGHTQVLDGFTSKAGKKFSSALRLVAEPGGGKVEFAFEDRKAIPDHDFHQDPSRQRQRGAVEQWNGRLIPVLACQ